MPPKLSRSEKRLRKDLVKAVGKREGLLRAGKLSLPSGEGVLSIIVSGRGTYPGILDHETVEREHEARLQEAKAVKKKLEHQHKGGVLIRPRAYIQDIKFDLADPIVTDLIFMGHGTINGICTDDDSRYFSWQDASRASNHLKQGVVEQRMCGHFSSDISLSVPMGTFLVSKLADLRAAVGVVLPLADASNSREHLFETVFTAEEPLIEQVLALNAVHTARTAQAAA
jgi:hypothetical protein